MSDHEGHSTDRLTPRNVNLSDQAIDWLVCLGADEAGEEDREGYENWRARSPAHNAAAQEAQEIFGMVGDSWSAYEYRAIGEVHKDQPARTAPMRVTRRRVLLGGAAGSVAVVFSGLLTAPAAAMLADHSTGLGERKEVTLSDGSSIHLNTSSALSVEYNATHRRIILHHGEALFDIAKDEARPFVVASGSGEARAVGTVYSVRQRGAISDVTVSEGVVEVTSGAASQRLVAGQSISYGENILSGARDVDAAAAIGWTRGKLIFNQQSLEEVASELERYQRGKIIVRGEKLRRLKVTGVFDLDDRDAMFRAISATAKVRIIQYPLLTIIH